ncbi:hypothetical protein ABEQ78_10900 [Bacillus altitudinis]|uniref:hypothetical protein n=1 Tax=Bacillus TaxID=1386 RepID=UPI0006F3070A|nr:MULTISPECIES: hypothetical protein [Bacillus]KQU08641.1 hypothetical protein ASG46_15675 [Bacillus sp. Leaf49]MCY7620212.1 hypothetical protein [Bacillus altitudinis]MDI6560542.1 hypothetical protein [Bacillus altitudinis]MED0850834.1 hypothetical protein [Bacillus altitudinis]WEZ71608.1 hypothetical protein P5623_01755 [Bacillus altitudinis]
MRLDKKDIILIFIILSLFIGDLLIYSGIINLFFKDKETMWAGIIAFTGAILGGAITYYGVRIQIQHREKEVFMSNVTETLTKIDELLYLLRPSFNGLYLLELTFNNSDINEEEVKAGFHTFVGEFNKILAENKNIVYRYIDYDLVELIESHQQFIFINRQKYDYENLYSKVEKCRYIFKALEDGKKSVKAKYRYYRN